MILHATRKFTSLNHPERDEDGVQKYSLYEIVISTEGEKHYLRVADDLNFIEVADWVHAYGEFE